MHISSVLWQQLDFRIAILGFGLALNFFKKKIRIIATNHVNETSIMAVGSESLCWFSCLACLTGSFCPSKRMQGNEIYELQSAKKQPANYQETTQNNSWQGTKGRVSKLEKERKIWKSPLLLSTYRHVAYKCQMPVRLLIFKAVFVPIFTNNAHILFFFLSFSFSFWFCFYEAWGPASDQIEIDWK